MLRPVHFEIHASEPERAITFYTAVFGWEFTRWQSPDAPEYWLIKTGEEDEPGINGGLIRRKGPPPVQEQAVKAYPCTIEVPDIDEYIEKVKTNDGRIAVDKMAIPGVGWVAYCLDTEKNLFGIMQADEAAK